MTAMAVLSFNSCKKEGCTDADADNYDSAAKTDDGSCLYTGEVVFWYNGVSSDNMDLDGITSLTYYLNGEIVGSSSATVFWTGAPSCGQAGSITVSKDLGSDYSKSYTYSVKDQDGVLIWDGTQVFTGNECTKVELTYN
ncbi:MAG: hypothetical protein RLZZ543_300 [Bacteroidota bacterium]